MADDKKKPVKATTLQVKPSEAALAIQHCIAKKISLFLWGPPGIGKSSIIKQVAKSIGMDSIDIRLSQMDPTDLRGVPYPANDATTKDIVDAVVAAASQAVEISMSRFDEHDSTSFEVTTRIVAEAAAKAAAEYAGRPGMKWAPPAVLPRDADAKVVVFLDELNTAAPSIQAAAYQLVLDRKLGEYVLPDGCVVIAAGNRDTDKGATFKMPTPLMNRFVHLELRHDYEDWFQWAVIEKIHKNVVGYTNTFKGELFEFDATSASRGFATPRSWEFVSKLLADNPNLPEKVLQSLIGGAIGDGIAIKFMEYCKRADELPLPSDILSGKVKELKNKDVSLCYALTTGLCYELKDGYEASVRDKKLTEKFDSMCDYFLEYMMHNFQPELVILGARMALNTPPRLNFQPTRLKNWQTFADRYQELILRA